MAHGLMGLMGGGPRGDVRERSGTRDLARYNGRPVMPKTRYFAHGGRTAATAHGKFFAEGGMVDPEDHAPEVSPELKLAAYELLECLDSSRYSGPDGKSGRAEAFARAMLAFVRLSDEMPHVEGEHEGEGEGEDGDEE